MAAFFTNTSSSNKPVNFDGKKVTSIISGIIDRKIKNLSKAKNIKKLAISKKSNFIRAKVNEVSKTDFLTPKTRVAFTQLRKTFTKAPISYYFNLKYHIWIKTNVSSYVISEILS